MRVQSHDTSPVADTRHRMLAMMSVYRIYEFAFVTMLGKAIGLMPILGGLYYFFGKVCVAMVTLANQENRKYLMPRWRMVYGILCACLFGFIVALTMKYPHAHKQWETWVMFAVVFGMMMRENIGRRLIKSLSMQTVSPKKGKGWFVFVALLPMLAVGIMLISHTSQSTWLLLMGGFVGDALLFAYSLWRDRGDASAVSFQNVAPTQVSKMVDQLKDANAYRIYEWMHAFILMALQLTLVLIVTFAGLSTRELLSCMMMLLLCIVGIRELTMWFLRLVGEKSVIQVLVVGLFVWLYGLFLLYQGYYENKALWWYFGTVCLGISGMTISVSALCDLEEQMMKAALFTLQGEDKAYGSLRAMQTDMVILVGQVIAFALLGLLCMPATQNAMMDASAMTPVIKPLLIAPILLLLLGALLGMVRFPMHNRHFQKLAKWLLLQKEGQENPALEKHLARVVIQKRKNRFGILILKALFRIGYRYEVVGAENIDGIPDGQMIFVCNHGEIYGPVAATLYTPAPVRPWGVAEMMDKDIMIEHIYQGTMMRQKWLPEAWKRPLVRLFSPFLLWLYDSLEGIAVYQNNPRKLMQTFRETIDAMQAGDNILLFPEKGEVKNPGDKGYVSQGVGKFYAGFATIAQLYYGKTKQCASFVPLYASKTKHVFYVGKPIVYQPEPHANEEKARIVEALLSAMKEFACLAGDQEE